MNSDLSTYLEQTISAVGPRLRVLRKQRETTLSDLSAATGISESTLSRLESGHRQPTLEHLLALARTYRMQVDELIGGPLTGDPRVHLQPVTRYGMTWLPLTRRAGGVQAHKLIIPAARFGDTPTLASHEGYEWLYILNGRVRLVLGDQDLVLTPGEAAEFDTHVPHWFSTADDASAELIILFGQQGERAHLRARSEQ
ncbi:MULTISPECIES: helix-turn-helix domain-containing protein [Rhodococcus]|uniref:helix-turn-helix domain-containing protein n=1 Tax=Rhodococcus TaxID=1827 RepID=UPI0005D4257C|nr:MULTISPECIES: XRE family transcriptional regulator [Rhodococcus]KJF22901.1 HTH-type transcriptional regulator PuuR [Rhodococcus sp. AD45]QXW03278.1 XRE family transcriptional regulator [Rhodococcus globerulus]